MLRLANADSLPNGLPDILYPSSSNLPPCDEVNSPLSTDTTFQPYIAAEFSAGQFKREFVVGGGEGVVEEGQQICNVELLPGVTYTAFLRAYPNSLMSREEFRGGARRRRQTGGEEGRQYEIFSSSNFLPAITTGEFSQALLEWNL